MIGMFASLTAVHAASFDCAKASSPTEKMICQNPKISKLDDRLSEVYKEIRKADASVVDEQRAWLKEARACKEEKCLENAYGARVEDLENRWAKLNRMRAQENSQTTTQAVASESNRPAAKNEQAKLDMFCSGVLLRTSGLIDENINRYAGEMKASLIQIAKHLGSNGEGLLIRGTQAGGKSENLNLGGDWANTKVATNVTSVIQKGSMQNNTVMDCLRRAQ